MYNAHNKLEPIRLGFISAVSEVGHFLVNSCDIVEHRIMLLQLLSFLVPVVQFYAI